jgi:ankyrin repeat protein
LATTLILAGADVASRDYYEETALHRAVRKGSVPLVKLLLDHGANPDVVDDRMVSPRQEAERVNVVGMMEAFAEADIKHGRKPEAAQNKTHSSLDRKHVSYPFMLMGRKPGI